MDLRVRDLSRGRSPLVEVLYTKRLNHRTASGRSRLAVSAAINSCRMGHGLCFCLLTTAADQGHGLTKGKQSQAIQKSWIFIYRPATKWHKLA